MVRSLAILSVVLLLAGCNSAHNNAEGDSMFGPVSMRIHPIFTQVKDWTGDGKPDGIEALIQFSDRFDDPTKAAGRVIFELYEYRREDPDARGHRLTDPWVGSTATLAEQREHWFSTTRTYNFQLAYPAIRYNRNYVLEATFERTGGGRFTDKIILVGETPKEPKRAQPATLPANTPSGRTPQP